MLNTLLVQSVCCCDILQYSCCLLALLRLLQNSNTMASDCISEIMKSNTMASDCISEIMNSKTMLMVSDCISEIMNDNHSWLVMSSERKSLSPWFANLSPMTNCSQQSIHLHGQYFNETLSALYRCYLRWPWGECYLLCYEWKYLLCNNYCTFRETDCQ